MGNSYRLSLFFKKNEDQTKILEIIFNYVKKFEDKNILGFKQIDYNEIDNDNEPDLTVENIDYTKYIDSWFKANNPSFSIVFNLKNKMFNNVPVTNELLLSRYIDENINKINISTIFWSVYEVSKDLIRGIFYKLKEEGFEFNFKEETDYGILDEQKLFPNEK